MLSPQSGQKILDVGAGKGELADQVSRITAGIEVYAIDPNPKKVEAIKRDHPSVKASTNGVESLPFPDAFFHKAYTTMALHHYADLDKALEEIGRVLKPGGSFVVLEVEPNSAKGRMFRLSGRIMGEHMTLMTAGQLSKRLDSSKDLKVIRTEAVGSGYLILLSRV
jgi:ubiquinone/menaquinone biosynthesis C-methylase UbiE